MKKAVLSILTISIALSLCTTSAFAANAWNGRDYTDTNSDGVWTIVNKVDRKSRKIM